MAKKKLKAEAKLKLKAKKKFYDYLVLCLLIICLISGFLIGVREYKAMVSDKEARNVMETFEALAKIDGPTIEYSEKDVKLGKYKVIGKIKIERVGIEYPILDRTDANSLNLSITKLVGPGLNALGNVTLAGHNTRNGKMFSRLHTLQPGDIIELTGNGKTLKYEVDQIYSVKPSETSSTGQNDGSYRELTLITCAAGGKQRLVVKAIELL